MNDKEFDQLKKDVNYAHMEGMLPSNTQLLVFKGADEAIAAIRNNEIPGVVWTEECEKEWIKKLQEESGAAE